jgi:hypothetical protein
VTLHRGDSVESVATFSHFSEKLVDEIPAEVIRSELRHEAAILLAMQRKALELHDALALENGEPTFGVQLEDTPALTV